MWPGDQRIQRRHQEDADQQPREQASDDDQGEGFLGVGADAGRHGRRQQSKGSYERGHHDRAQAEDGGLAGRLGDAEAALAELVRIGDEDHGRLHRDAEQRNEADAGGYGERSVRDLQCQQSADRIREHDREYGDHGELEVRVEHEQQHEDHHQRDRHDDLELLSGSSVVLVFAAPDDPVAGR